MAKFRDSKTLSFVDAQTDGYTSTESVDDAAALRERSIGEILSELRNLNAQQVESVLSYQREKGVRFGEAAVALKLASTDDVLFALSQQFHYPYAEEGRRKVTPELIALNQPFSHQAEAFRAIRSQVMMRVFPDLERRRALAVVSPESGDGKTFFSANLAVALAQLGGKTLLVDADLRNPRQHEVFGLDSNLGLSSVLSGRGELQVIQQVAGVPTLFVLPVGVTPPNPLELVERPAFTLLLRELCNRFDHVIVDTPAAVHGSDSLAIASRCGAALVVARRDQSRVDALQDLVASLSESPAKMAGVVFNEY